MAVGADGLDWDFIRAYANATPAQKAQIDAVARTAQNQPGQQFVPTVQNGQITIPATGTPRASAPTYTAQPVASAPIIDPTTSRTVYSGPQGEAGAATRAQMEAFAVQNGLSPSLIQTNVIGGVTSYYIPNVAIQNGNRVALGLAPTAGATSVAPGANADTVRGFLDAAKKAASSQTDAELGASIATILRQNGLEALIPMVGGWLTQGLTWPQIEAQLYDPTSEPGRIVDSIYPELRRRREKGFTPVSIQEIQQYRRDAYQLIDSKGLKAAFPNLQQDVTNWLSDDKSLAEQKARLDLIENQVSGLLANDPRAQADLEAWERYYGVRPSVSDIVSLAINEQSLPAVERKVRAVAFDVQAGRAGFGDLSRAEAEGLTNYGVDPSQSGNTFGQLAGLTEVFSPLAGTGEDQITREEQLAAGFGGNEFAARRIQKRQAARVGAFQQGGGFASSQEGFTGVGNALK